MGRMRLRKQFYLNTKYIIICIIIIIVLFVLFLINKFTDKSLPYLVAFAESESIELINMIVNNAVREEVFDKEISKVSIIDKNNDGEIVNISYDNVLLNEILYDVSNNILENISNIEKSKYKGLNSKFYSEKDMVFYVPIGIVYDIPILTDISPKIPYKVSFLGSVDSFIDTKVSEYGINNSLVVVSININMNLKVIFPFLAKDVVINRNIPISSNIIKGKIPEFYGGILTNSSSIKTN